MKPFNLYCLLCTFAFISCNRYYMPVSTKDPKIELIKKYTDENRRLILRQPSTVYEMQNVRLDENSGEIFCDLQKVSGLQTMQGARGKSYYYKPARPDSVVSNQVHLHTSRVFANDSALSTIIPVSAISIVEELQFDKRKTSRHNLAIGLGITAGVATVVAVVAAVKVLNELSQWGD